MATGSAPGKVILFGEHAVVYGRPAIAAPVSQLAAIATVTAGEPGSGCVLDLSDIGETIPVTGGSIGQPLALAAQLALETLGVQSPDWRITVHSTIPISSGLGSGAATATAIVRALAAAAGQSLNAAFRPEQAAERPSPAALRVQVSRHHDGVAVQVLKRRGGWVAGPVQLSLDQLLRQTPEPRLS